MITSSGYIDLICNWLSIKLLKGVFVRLDDPGAGFAEHDVDFVTRATEPPTVRWCSVYESGISLQV